MKKVVFLSACLLVLLTGCDSKKEEVLKCTLHQKDVVNGFELNATYEVKAVDGVALSNKTVEVITSESEELLDYFEETVGATYEAANKNYGGYDFTPKREEGKYTSDAIINYEEMNLAAYVKDQPALKNFMTKDQKGLQLRGLKAVYETMGASCTIEEK